MREAAGGGGPQPDSPAEAKPAGRPGAPGATGGWGARPRRCGSPLERRPLAVPPTVFAASPAGQRSLRAGRGSQVGPWWVRGPRARVLRAWSRANVGSRRGARAGRRLGGTASALGPPGAAACAPVLGL